MEAKAQSAAATRVYEDFEPSAEWVQEDGSDTLLVYLPGFRREQLKVQVTSSQKLRISGERLLGGMRWNRFCLEFRIGSNYDSNGISAKFEGGLLYIKHPKMITPAEQQGKDAPKTDKMVRSEEPPAQKHDQEHHGTKQQDNSTPSKDNKETNRVANANSVSQKIPEKEEPNEKIPEKKEPNAADAKKKDDGLVTDREKQEKIGHLAENAASKIDKGASGSADAEGKGKLESCKMVGGGLKKEMQKPKEVMNLVAAGLLVMVFVLYVINAIRSFGKSTHEDE